jgi:hypothetical protein
MVDPTKYDYEVPFEIEIPAELDRATLTTFGVDLWNSGPTVLHGYYQVNTSHVVVPVRTAAKGGRASERP